MNNDIEEVRPFDSFTAVYKILVWTGFYKLLNNTANGYKRIFHEIYRHLAFLLVIVYTLQHIYFAALNHHDIGKLMDNLIVGIPHANLIMKVGTLLFQTSRIDKLNNSLRDEPTFRANDDQTQTILKQNKEEIHRLNLVMGMSVSITVSIWTITFFAKRFNDPTEVVPSYFPFATDTWATFSLSVFLECGPSVWVSFGHIALDILVSTYYAHGQTQIKIIKHRLENFLGTEENSLYLKSNFQYKDVVDENVAKHFIVIVKHYEKLVWYVNEIDTIFNFFLTFQFMSSSFIVCIVVYRMTVVSVASFPFLFLVVLIFIFLAQVLLYCYYANLLEFESHSIVNSLYNSDWLSLSPTFRRQLLIAMIRWSRPLQPRVCHIIPLSISTFLTIVKSSYTLYTVLVTAKINDIIA